MFEFYCLSQNFYGSVRNLKLIYLKRARKKFHNKNRNFIINVQINFDFFFDENVINRGFLLNECKTLSLLLIF